MSMTTVGEAGATIAGNIRAEMARQKRQGTDLAAVLNMSQTAVSRRLNGLTGLDVDELFTIAAWLDVPVTDLLHGVDAKNIAMLMADDFRQPTAA